MSHSMLPTETLQNDSKPEEDSDSDSDDETLDQMMQKVKAKVEKRNHFIFAECIQRNVILIGRSRTGKSTVAKVIEDPYFIPNIAKLYAETREVCFHKIAAPLAQKDKIYHLTIIDTPGLYDKVNKTGEELSNKRIQEIIYECIQKDVTHINAFGFVFSSDTGINTEDIDSMIFVKENFSAMSDSFFLLLTHCEEKTDSEAEEFLEEFFQHPRVNECGLKAFFSRGTFFMGSLRPQLRRKPNSKAAISQVKRIMLMREKLLKFIIEAEKTFNIHYVPPPSSPTVEPQENNEEQTRQEEQYVQPSAQPHTLIRDKCRVA